jgi:hypothetical protein
MSIHRDCRIVNYQFRRCSGAAVVRNLRAI